MDNDTRSTNSITLTNNTTKSTKPSTYPPTSPRLIFPNYKDSFYFKPQYASNQNRHSFSGYNSTNDNFSTNSFSKYSTIRSRKRSFNSEPGDYDNIPSITSKTSNSFIGTILGKMFSKKSKKSHDLSETIKNKLEANYTYTEAFNPKINDPLINNNYNGQIKYCPHCTNQHHWALKNSFNSSYCSICNNEIFGNQIYLDPSNNFKTNTNCKYTNYKDLENLKSINKISAYYSDSLSSENENLKENFNFPFYDTLKSEINLKNLENYTLGGRDLDNSLNNLYDSYEEESIVELSNNKNNSDILSVMSNNHELISFLDSPLSDDSFTAYSTYSTETNTNIHHQPNDKEFSNLNSNHQLNNDTLSEISSHYSDVLSSESFNLSNKANSLWFNDRILSIQMLRKFNKIREIYDYKWHSTRILTTDNYSILMPYKIIFDGVQVNILTEEEKNIIARELDGLHEQLKSL